MNASTATSGRRVALITGAARGIGSAVAAELANEGYALALVDVRSDVDARAAEFRAQGVPFPPYAQRGPLVRRVGELAAFGFAAMDRRTSIFC